MGQWLCRACASCCSINFWSEARPASPALLFWLQGVNAHSGRSGHAVNGACPPGRDGVGLSAQGPQALDPERAAAGRAVDGRGRSARGARAQQVAVLGRHYARQRRVCRAGGRWAPCMQIVLREGVAAQAHENPCAFDSLGSIEAYGWLHVLSVCWRAVMCKACCVCASRYGAVKCHTLDMGA